MSDLQFYAQPYSLDPKAEGFYFNDLDAYREKVATMKDSFGHPIEEFQHILIDTDHPSHSTLWKALGGDEYAPLKTFLDIIETADDHQIIQIIGMLDLGMIETWGLKADEIIEKSEDLIVYDDPREGFGGDVWEAFGEYMVYEGLYGEIPDHLKGYIDYAKIGRDLSHEGYRELLIPNGKGWSDVYIIDSQSV